MTDFHGKTCGTCKHFMPYDGKHSGRCKKRPFIKKQNIKKVYRCTFNSI